MILFAAAVCFSSFSGAHKAFCDFQPSGRLHQTDQLLCELTVTDKLCEQTILRSDFPCACKVVQYVFKYFVQIMHCKINVHITNRLFAKPLF